MIKMIDICKTYHINSPRQVNAIKNITLEIEEGTITALGGPSGSGKSTTLSIIGLLTRPSRGQIYLEEEDVSRVSEVYRTRLRREKIGFIFQNQYLIPQLTAVENVALPLLCTDQAKSQAEDLARSKLAALGLEHRLEFPVAELSGGELQRVGIARALMNNPRILIADEPSASIDETLTKELLTTLREMVDRRKLTIIVASHDEMVLEWADICHMMHDGEIVKSN